MPCCRILQEGRDCIKGQHAQCQKASAPPSPPERKAACGSRPGDGHHRPTPVAKRGRHRTSELPGRHMQRVQRGAQTMRLPLDAGGHIATIQTRPTTGRAHAHAPSAQARTKGRACSSSAVTGPTSGKRASAHAAKGQQAPPKKGERTRPSPHLARATKPVP